jgi:hypothetical protein
LKAGFLPFRLDFKAFKLDNPIIPGCNHITRSLDSHGCASRRITLLPSQSSQSSGSSTLPTELNPLSNQLLAENLRLWAEVYFSNPPERREQAISELLRELQEQKAQQHVVANGTASVARPEPGSIFPAANSAPSVVRCKSCGHENDLSQRFCGMCGAVAGVPEPSTYSQFEEPSPPDWQTAGSAGTGDRGTEERWESESDSVPAYEEMAPSTNELSLFQAVPQGSGHEDPVWEYDTSPTPPYRLYIGLVLAVMLVGLGYLAWRGMQGNSQSHQVSAPPPAVAKDAETPPALPPTPKAETPPKNSAQVTPSDQARGVASKAEKKAAGNSRRQPTPAAETEPIPAQTGPGKGEQELSIAEQYLSGTDGKRRDTAEASKWLWKSVAKHNDKATLLLADLYLKGDGVSKNCDQARVLLYSAARKGMSGAGERLRNLQAFGCQ